MEIKKVVKRLYEFNLGACSLSDGTEILSNGIDDELSRVIRKVDTSAGLLVQPSGYKKGLVFLKSSRELLNNPEWNPAIVKFNLEVLGLKKNSYYRVTVIARNFKKYIKLVDVTDDRSLQVLTNNNDMLIMADLTENLSSKEFAGIFKAYSNECVLSFKLGKIAIKNIIIEEVELMSESFDESGNEIVVDENRSQVISTSVFSMKAESTNLYQNKWVALLRLYGKGINLYYNKNTLEYLIERDNVDDVVGDNLNANYILVSLNTTKLPNTGFITHRIKAISSDLSPNTLKSGYILFDFIDARGKAVAIDDGKLGIKVEKLI